MAIAKHVDGENVTYLGILDISDPIDVEAGDPERKADARGTSRDEVAWGLRVAFAKRLEHLAREAALLRHLMESDDPELDDDPVLRDRIPSIVRELANGLWQLRSNEPSLVLCGDMVDGPEPYSPPKISIGSRTFDPHDWGESMAALEQQQNMAARDRQAHGALSASLEALAAKGKRGPAVAELVFVVAAPFVYAILPEAVKRGLAGEAVAAFVEAVVFLSGSSDWSMAIAGDKGKVALLASRAGDRVRHELMSPEQRELALQADAAMDHALSQITTAGRGARKEIERLFPAPARRTASRAPKKAIAAKTVRRPRAKRSASRGRS